MKLIVFGIGNTSEVVTYYIEKWQLGSVCAYTVDSAYCSSSTFLGKPVLPPDEIVIRFPPHDFSAFVAIGYLDSNNMRTEKLKLIKSFGYSIVSVINPLLPRPPYFCYRENCVVIPDDLLIVPGASIGTNVFIWNKCSIGHHVIIEDNCWISTGTIIGGNTTIGKNSFIGMGVTISNGISIGDGCVIGIGSTVKKSIKSGCTVISQAGKIVENSNKYISAFIK
jgi:sugar O-acyltransferase (sialic acid O-acetyltransferase NeuD family)